MTKKRYHQIVLLLALAGLGRGLPGYSHPAAVILKSDDAGALRGKAPGGGFPAFAPPVRHPNNPAADLDIIRQRIIADLLEPAINEAEISRLMQSVRPDGTWPDINYQDVSRTGFEHSRHLEHMLALSRAYKKPGSPFAGNPALKKTVAAALDFWLAHDFICDNWWWNEMGTPNLMINILLVLDTDLTEKQRREGLRIAGRANLGAFGARPGGDLIQIAGMQGKQGLFTRNPEVLAKVVQVMAAEIKVTTGRGLKPDLSFHHRTDNVISTLAYGTGYASAFAYWAVKVAGTQFVLPDTAMKLLVDYFLDGICQSMVYGRYPDPGAKNRDLSRQDALEAVGPELARNLLLASPYRREELAALVKIRQGLPAPAFRRTHFFWHSEYFTHQRPDYFASVRMHSDRGANMEEPHNEEGLKNHHFADGANFISLTGKEYANIFPVWDWQKIPGTTVVQKPALPHWKEIAKKGRTGFVGGVTDGEYGAAAFDFASVHDPLRARKAWFFFDKEYVSLGAGISAEADNPVATTLNQCLLDRQVVIMRNNREEPLPKGEHTLTDVAWVAHGNIAYLFPAPTTLHLQNAPATGNWRSINHQAWATQEEVQQDVFKLWLDHGTKPRAAAYAYTVVPNLAPAAIEAYRNRSGIVIVANSAEVQAVTNRQLNCSQVVFYQAGQLKLADDLTLTAASPCMVMIKTGKKGIEKITVSDPGRKLTSLQLILTARFEGAGDNWQATWNRKDRTSMIRVDLPAAGMAGQSVVLEKKG
jgi:chondroitin AC lyase